MDGEQLFNMEQALRAAHGADREALELQVGQARHERDWYNAQVERAKAMVGDRWEVDQVVKSSDIIHYQDPGQRLRLIRARLLADGRLTPEQAKSIEVNCPPYAVKVEHDRRVAEEVAGIRKGYAEILAAATDPERARQLYNAIDAPGDEDKLNRWVRDCAAEGVLPLEYLPGRRLGGWLHKIIHKHGGQA